MEFVSKNKPRAYPAAENPAAEQPLCSLGTNVWENHSSAKKGNLCPPRMSPYQMLQCHCPWALKVAQQLPVPDPRGEKQILQLTVFPSISHDHRVERLPSPDARPSRWYFRPPKIYSLPTERYAFFLCIPQHTHTHRAQWSSSPNKMM